MTPVYLKEISLVDSHAHLNMEEFDKDLPEIIQRAHELGIEAILCPTDITEKDRHPIAVELTRSHSWIYLAAGVHPHHADKFQPECEIRITKLAEEDSIVAVGEIGLDFHYNFSPPSLQLEVFQKQLRLAQVLDLPVVIHCRKAGEEVSRAIEKSSFTGGGVLHCFTEDWEFAQLMMKKGFYVSFSGIVTFPNAQQLRETARKIPIEKLMVETDSPFLVPAPYQGKIKRNEPRFVLENARFLADLKNIDFKSFAEKTTENFYRCFRIEI